MKMMKKFFAAFLVISSLLCCQWSVAQEKTTQVLCIGNSFTFFYDSNLRLEEIAAGDFRVV